MANETTENNEGLVLTPEQQEVIFKPLVAFAQGVQKAGLVAAGAPVAVGGFVKKHAESAGMGPRDFYTAGVEGSPIAMMLFEMTADLFTKTKDFMKDTFFGSKEDRPATEGVQEDIKTGVENIDESLQEDPGSGLEEIERERERLREERRKKKTGFEKVKGVAGDVFGSKLMGAALVAGIAAWMLGEDGRDKIKDAVGGWFEDIEWKKLIVDALPSPEQIIDPETAATTGAVAGKIRRLAGRGPLAPGTATGAVRNWAKGVRPPAAQMPTGQGVYSRNFLKTLADKGQNISPTDGKIRWNAGQVNAAGKGIGGRIVAGAVKAEAAAVNVAQQAASRGSISSGAVKVLKAVAKKAPWIGSAITLGFTEHQVSQLQELADSGEISQEYIDGLIWRKRWENYMSAAFGIGATALVGTAALAASGVTFGAAAIPGMVATAATGYAASEAGESLGGFVSDKMGWGTAEELESMLQKIQPEQIVHEVVADDLQAQQIMEDLSRQLLGMGGGGGDVVDASTTINSSTVPFVPPTVAFPTGTGPGTENSSWMGFFTPPSQSAP
jgi:hypothetical protein